MVVSYNDFCNIIVTVLNMNNIFFASRDFRIFRQYRTYTSINIVISTKYYISIVYAGVKNLTFRYILCSSSDPGLSRGQGMDLLLCPFGNIKRSSQRDVTFRLSNKHANKEGLPPRTQYSYITDIMVSLLRQGLGITV